MANPDSSDDARNKKGKAERSGSQKPSSIPSSQGTKNKAPNVSSGRASSSAAVPAIEHAALEKQTKTLASDEILFRGHTGTFLHVDPKSGSVEERVPTTGGFTLKSNIHTIAPLTRLEKTNTGLKHLDADGNLLTEHSLTQAANKVVRYSNTGWVVNAVWTNTSSEPITSFLATFTVPPPPTNTSDPLIYIFIAIECAQEDDILQPVLKWGPCPEPRAPNEVNCWSVYSTFISARLPTQETKSIRVDPGRSLTASISLSHQAAKVLNYVCEFVGIPETRIPLGSEGDIGTNLKCFIVLEAYNTRFADTDYPQTGKTVFSHITVQTATGFPIMQWQIESRNLLDSEHVAVITDGPQNGVIEIVYNETTS